MYGASSVKHGVPDCLCPVTALCYMVPVCLLPFFSPTLPPCGSLVLGRTRMNFVFCERVMSTPTTVAPNDAQCKGEG